MMDPPGWDKLPPRVQLLVLTHGKRISQTVYAAAELQVADHLVDGPRTPAELAAAIGCDATALYRLLRCTAAVGVFRERADGAFELTPMAEALRSDIPGSQRDLVLLNGDEMSWRPYGDIVHSIRTGEPAFERVFGRSYFEHLAAHPVSAELFDRAMTQMSRFTTASLLEELDLTGYDTIVDVGGGRGYFLAEVLRRRPESRGVLADRAPVVAEAGPLLEKAGVADRVTVRPTDFFAEVPPGGDAYLLKAVLHDWDDPQATRILSRIREAIGDRPGACLFVLEHVVAPANAWDAGKFIDIDMLLRFGGRERNRAEWQRLLGAAGFELANDPAAGRWAVLQCRPR